ncbi:DGAT1/2-independent enzyme synthesizing storage lipids-like [Elgaria multicarinata webbii]|uniref:DGAT1/2-independent enzyme synthesizing storage lipids-like n=1 Tax=Elgaria multicarinata webbii TaxID=159646 RepID=UPI002FCCDC7D
MNVAYIFGEWIGTMCLEKYLFSGIMWLLLALLAVPVWIGCCCVLSVLMVQILGNIIQSKETYQLPFTLIAIRLWDIFGRIWHGYEVHGIENLPEGPALIIYYHGVLSLDYIFFALRLYLLKKRFCHSVVHKIIMKIPGLRKGFERLHLITTKEACLSALQCDLLGIAPGGAQEGLLSDENYSVIWGKHTGFAQVAIEAKVPIIPLFTKNTREAYKWLGSARALRYLYENFRLILFPVCGGFPVKWDTYIGEPIPYDPNTTAEELAKKTKIALETLIDKHQKRPGSVGRALLERFSNHRKND